MRLFVTGGAGHTGCNFLRFYLSDSTENTAVALVRQTSNLSYLPTEFGDRLTVVFGDLRDATVGFFLSGCDAIMHIAHQKLCPQVIAAATSSQVKRVFFVTTTGVFSSYNDLSRDYIAIEEGIRKSDLSWTILRPTMIFGSERDSNLHKLLIYLNRRSFFPIFGDGRGLMQPVYVEDLAVGLLLALKQPEKTSMKEYNLPGRYPQSYNEIVESAATCMDRQARLLHIPRQLSLTLSSIAELALGSKSPIKTEQIRRLSEDKAYSWAAAKTDFSYEPRVFEVGLSKEIERLRHVGLLT
jgi:nucleoside-diphosphate-sugar epimerase